jgi:hypothetical protein
MIARSNVHRRNRRRLGKGQQPPLTSVGVVVSSTGTTNVTLTFSTPVVVSGPIAMTVATRTLSAQTIVSPTVVTFVASGNVTGLGYTVPPNQATVVNSVGGRLAGAAGTFP